MLIGERIVPLDAGRLVSTMFGLGTGDELLSGVAWIQHHVATYALFKRSSWREQRWRAIAC